MEYINDDLGIYRGRDIYITDKIIVTQPTLDDIERFGEELYFKSVHTLTSVGADLKWQLWDYYHIDYTQISDYDLFVRYIYRWISSGKIVYQKLTENPEKYKKELSELTKEKIKELLINPMELVLKDLDFADFIPIKRKYGEENEQVVLYNPDKDIFIDKLVYSRLVKTIRKIHGFKRNNEMPINERTKMDLIEDARDDAMFSSKEPFKSILLPIVSTLKIKTGNRDIWDSKINEFFYDAKRVGAIQETELLLSGAYSGFGSLKGIGKEKLDLFRSLDMG